MAEEQIIKKAGLIKRVLKKFFLITKWLFAVILAVLLVGGLVLQAPWKALTLMAVILATLTIIPKSARKWVWLCFGVVIVVLVIWVFLPDDNEGWRPYTFDEELAELQAKYAVPDEDNAAIIYNQLLEVYEPNDFKPEFRDRYLDCVTSRQSWSGEDYPQMADWLKSHENTIKILLQACEKDLCRFPMHTGIMSDEFGVRQGPMRKWAQLLICSAKNDLGEGRIDAAIEKYLAVCQMAKHLYQQSIFLDLLSGISIKELVTKQLDSVVIEEQPTETHITLIEETLSQFGSDWESDFIRIFESETLFLKNMVSFTLYEVNSSGKIRLARKLTVPIRGQWMALFMFMSGEEDVSLNYWQIKLCKARTIWAWFWMPSTPQKVAKIIDNVYKRFDEIANPNYDWNSGLEGFSYKSIKLNFDYIIELLSYIVEPACYKVYVLYMQAASDNKAAQIIIALRR